MVSEGLAIAYLLLINEPPLGLNRSDLPCRRDHPELNTCLLRRSIPKAIQP